MPAVVAVMVHTDMPNYPAVLREVARALRPGGSFVHIGVHPCFCGGFADRADESGILIQPGYLRTYFTKDSWTDRGIRDKVGAMHRPLPELLHAILDAGLVLERFQEGGAPTPTTLRSPACGVQLGDGARSGCPTSCRCRSAWAYERNSVVSRYDTPCC